MAAAAITDPLNAAKMIGLVDLETQWVLGELAMRYLFLAAAVIWAFAWYHGVNKRMERGASEPNMPLHQALRWIARDSVWASKYHWSDDEWPQRVAAELFSKWQLGLFEMMGVEKTGPSGAMSYLPPSMKGSSEFETHKLCTPEPPTHIWDWVNVASDKLPRRFFQVRLDRADVTRVWPRRSWLARMRHKSPIERIGDYAEIFRKQDEWYSKNYEQFPPTPLGWLLR